jgi:hypothetical protein
MYPFEIYNQDNDVIYILLQFCILHEMKYQ